jgi:dihydropteroate synthase
MYARKPYSVPLPDGRTLELGARTVVMGILNITPDSFADGGQYLETDRAVAAGIAMVADGADILDVGGESTRPGAAPVGAEEELRRVLPVIEQLRSQTTALISIDTYKASVARQALQRGATIVNDISGLQYDPDLARVTAEAGAAVVLMHTRGRSRDMYEHAVYEDVAAEVVRELEEAIGRAAASGVTREAIIVDPGFGFAKRAEHSYTLLAQLHKLAELDRPVLSGPSRKSFLKQAVGDKPPSEREWATAAAVAASVLFGAHIIRVHGVRAMADVARVADQLRESASR